MNGACWKSNYLQPLLMGNINTFQRHLQLANMSHHEVSKCDCISQHINHKVIIHCFKCLLLPVVQFCLAHVFSPDFHKARAVVLCYVTDATNFQTCVCWPLWLWAYQGQIILPLSARSVLWQAPFHEPQHPWKLCDCVRKQFHLEQERKGGNYWSCIRDISQQTQNHHAILWSRLSHENDEHDEDDLDSEDECLVDELMVFNV